MFSKPVEGKLCLVVVQIHIHFANTRSDLDLKESLLAHAIEMFPFMANVKLMRQWAGMTDMTQITVQLWGKSPYDNYYLDAGWGTWGFKASTNLRQDHGGTGSHRSYPRFD